MTNDGRSTADGALPDVEHDEAAIAAYEDAKLRYIRGITADAEGKLRDALGKRRETIAAEIAELRAVHKRLHETAAAAQQRYASLLPHRLRKSGLRAPSAWERILTLDLANRRFLAARLAAEERDEASDMLRKLRERLEAMERETRRSINMREEAVRRKLQTPEGLAALHGDASVKAAFATMQGVLNARAKYDERVKRGDVPPEAARDHEMAQRGMAFATAPLDGAIIARIARYGPLEYYVLRDLAKREYLLSLDPALEPLRDVVFDVSFDGPGCVAALHVAGNGEPMSVLDHLKASFSLTDVADLHARHRAALRTDRATIATPPRDENEAAVLAALTSLARTVDTRTHAASLI